MCKSLSFSNIGYLTLQSGNGTDMITPSVGTELKFSSDTKKQIPLTASGDFQKATPVGTCGCDNYLMEAHYKVFFEPATTANQFTITKLVVDVVYGSLADGNCNPLVLTQKTSVQFMQSEGSRQYSGSPGYIKGRPILFAKAQDLTKLDDSGNEVAYT